MKKTNMTSDQYLISSDLGLDMSFAYADQFGDLKVDGDLGNDCFLDIKSQAYNDMDSFLPDSQLTNNEFGLDWMYDADLSSYVDVIEDFLPLESKKENSFDNNIETVNNGYFRPVDLITGEEYDPGLSQPNSPAQVPPVITIPDESFNSGTLPVEINSSKLVINLSEVSYEDIISGSIDFAENVSLSSPLSAEDVESFLSVSEPASPKSKASSSSDADVILSSPELYKIISSSSNLSKRFAPYKKPTNKLNNDSKSKRLSKAPSPKSEFSDDEILLACLNKKDKKKMQNKNAAIRYRMKKKEEALCMKSEVDELEEINQSLKTKVDDLQREITYMTNLMEEVRKAKGL